MELSSLVFVYQYIDNLFIIDVRSLIETITNRYEYQKIEFLVFLIKLRLNFLTTAERNDR